MGFGICGHRFRRSPFTNKIFYIYKSPESLLTPLVTGGCRPRSGGLGRPSEFLPRGVISSLRFASRQAGHRRPSLQANRGGSAARPPARATANRRPVPVPVQPVFNCAVALPGFILCGRGFISIMLNVFNT